MENKIRILFLSSEADPQDRTHHVERITNNNLSNKCPCTINL